MLGGWRKEKGTTLIVYSSMGGGGGDVAQLVERRTGTPLRQVQFPGAARDFFPPESTFSADSLTVSEQLLCAIACINICSRVKDPKHWQPYLCLDTRKYRTHC